MAACSMFSRSVLPLRSSGIQRLLCSCAGHVRRVWGSRVETWNGVQVEKNSKEIFTISYTDNHRYNIGSYHLFPRYR